VFAPGRANDGRRLALVRRLYDARSVFRSAGAVWVVADRALVVSTMISFILAIFRFSLLCLSFVLYVVLID
jgi:hypothetical protein